MILTQFASSSHDELFWGADSSARGANYRIEAGRVAFGALSAADGTDFFQITPGVGSFSLVVSADAANGWSSSSLRTDFGIRITDANGDGIVELSEGCLAVVLTEDGSAARLVVLLMG